MARANSILQVRLGDELKDAFVAASARADMTPSQAARKLIEGFVRDAIRAEARRQSLLVAAAPDAEDTMDEAMRVQDWLFD